MFDINSEIGKVVNGIVVTPSENEKKKVISTNPDNEILKATLKYIDMEVGEQPEYDAETQYIEQVHEIVEEEVVVTRPVLKVKWVARDIPTDGMTEGDV